MVRPFQEFIEAHRPEVIADILRLVSLRSVSSDRAACREALAAFLRMAEEAGLRTRLAAGGDVGVAEAGPDDAETLGILAHVDVVDAGSEEAWTRSPWGELADGAVWGRGRLDDKGPRCICVWALRAALDSGLSLTRRVRFIVGTMEEVDWADMRAYLATEPPPDFGFTPDGEFPVINREKGHCDVVLRFSGADRERVGAARLLSLRAGEAANAVPDLAEAELEGPGVLAALRNLAACEPPGTIELEPGSGERVRVRARGRAVHSSVPERGDNALVRLCAVLSGLGGNGFIDFVSDIFAGIARTGAHLAHGLGLQTRPEYALGEYVGPASASPDLARSSEAELTLVVNVRSSYGQTEDELRAVFEASSERYGYTVSTEGFLPALCIARDEPFMRALLEAYEEGSGLPGEFILAPGTSYAKAMPHVAAFGPILPGSPDLCHERDERLALGDLDSCLSIYASAIAKIACA